MFLYLCLDLGLFDPMCVHLCNLRSVYQLLSQTLQRGEWASNYILPYIELSHDPDWWVSKNEMRPQEKILILRAPSSDMTPSYTY